MNAFPTSPSIDPSPSHAAAGIGGDSRLTDTAALADRIDALLPQTQCTQCGFDGCRPYADAIAAGDAGIDRCPPGGDAGVVRLATLLGRPVVPLDASCGTHKARHVAVIDERHCIGCTLCIQACPVDAIVGANKFLHTVLADACSGCELCVAPCPVDCISMAPARAWTQDDMDHARIRHRQRNVRLSRGPRAGRVAASTVATARTRAQTPGGAGTEPPTPVLPTPDTNKRDVIAAALARARARRAGESTA
jgi:electron transport complex protein RnfB